jgi:hypothetical protein
MLLITAPSPRSSPVSPSTLWIFPLDHKRLQTLMRKGGTKGTHVHNQCNQWHTKCATSGGQLYVWDFYSFPGTSAFAFSSPVGGEQHLAQAICIDAAHLACPGQPVLAFAHGRVAGRFRRDTPSDSQVGDGPGRGTPWGGPANTVLGLILGLILGG